LRAVGQYISENLHFVPGTDEHLRLVLDHIDLRRLTTQVGTTILDILGKKSDYVTGLFEEGKKSEQAAGLFEEVE
jgi:hypothetical protein